MYFSTCHQFDIKIISQDTLGDSVCCCKQEKKDEGNIAEPSKECVGIGMKWDGWYFSKKQCHHALSKLVYLFVRFWQKNWLSCCHFWYFLHLEFNCDEEWLVLHLSMEFSWVINLGLWKPLFVVGLRIDEWMIKERRGFHPVVLFVDIDAACWIVFVTLYQFLKYILSINICKQIWYPLSYSLSRRSIRLLSLSCFFIKVNSLNV